MQFLYFRRDFIYKSCVDRYLLRYLHTSLLYEILIKYQPSTASYDEYERAKVQGEQFTKRLRYEMDVIIFIHKHTYKCYAYADEYKVCIDYKVQTYTHFLSPNIVGKYQR